MKREGDREKKKERFCDSVLERNGEHKNKGLLGTEA